MIGSLKEFEENNPYGQAAKASREWMKENAGTLIKGAIGPGLISNTITKIEDLTNKNLGTDILQEERAYAEEQQAKQWQREDEIRREVQRREDNAMQRAVEDAKAAGINPNLMDIKPAESGGGITSATGKDMTTYEKQVELIMQEIDNSFTASENEKDRLKDLVKGLITGGAILGAATMRKK